MAAARHEEAVVIRMVTGLGVAAALLILAATGAVTYPAAAAAPARSVPACENNFGAKTPVLLVHGFHEGTDVWGSMTKAIQAAVPEAAVVAPFDYPNTDWVTDPSVGPKLAEVIRCLATDSKDNGGAGKVIIVAHSMGGLAVRCAVDPKCAGTDAVNQQQIGLVITLGTPNTGSWLATAGNALSSADVIACEAILALQTGFNLPCPDLGGWLLGSNSPAAQAMAIGLDGKPSQDLSALQALPSTIPLDAVAGQITVTTSLFDLPPFHVNGPQFDLGDLVVLPASAQDGAPPTTPAHPGTSTPHPGPGSGTVTIPCGTISIPSLIGSQPAAAVPDMKCWHLTETTNQTWQAHVLAAIQAYLSSLSLTGLTWTPTQVPLPANAATSPTTGANVFLNGIACPADGTCVAVGSYTDTNTNGYGLIETLSHGTWTPIQAPGPGNASAQPQASLSGVSCPTAGNCVATGSYTDQSGHLQGLIETLSGGTWTAAQGPALAGTSTGIPLGAVACAAVDACVATGSYTDQDSFNQAAFVTLADQTWTASAAPLPGSATGNSSLDAIACPATGNCIATGGYDLADSGQGQGLIETLSHGAWTPSVAPLPAGASNQDLQLPSVACPAPGVCVAAGAYDWTPAGTGIRPLIETLSSGTWTASAAPLPSGASSFAALEGVACPTVGACVATGTYNNTPQGTISGTLPWTDALSQGSWTSDVSVPVAGAPGGLGAVSCPTLADCVAVVAYNHPFAVAVETGRHR
jgi:pimeloyl-ACP methyl ester carboxylesterase